MEPDLDELREPLRATRVTAERVAGAIPPQGWAVPEAAEAADEVRALLSVLQALRDLVPPELREQIREVARGLLVLLRAILDLLAERLERPAEPGGRPSSAPRVQDIPIA